MAKRHMKISLQDWAPTNLFCGNNGVGFEDSSVAPRAERGQSVEKEWYARQFREIWARGPESFTPLPNEHLAEVIIYSGEQYEPLEQPDLLEEFAHLYGQDKDEIEGFYRMRG